MLIRRIRYWLESGKRSAELQAEMDAHIEERAATLREQGLTASDARAEARRLFGNLIHKQEESRAIWITRWWADFLQDIQHGGRTFWKEKGFTAAAVLTLALGIGANTAIFSIVKAVILEPLPYRQSGRLVQMIQTVPATISLTGKATRVTVMEFKQFFELQKRSQTLAQLAVYDSRIELTLDFKEPVRVITTQISASLFPMLGVQPFLGRTAWLSVQVAAD